MSDRINPFIGTWSLNPGASAFDARHQPRAARMQIALDTDGWILITAEGVNERGEPCVERPNRLNPDGHDYPVPDFAGLVVRTTCPDARTMLSECRRQDGTIVGSGTFTVSSDSRSLTATTSGWDSQLREFKQTTRWERQ